MNFTDVPTTQKPAAMTDEEWALRVDLAACYRLFDKLGWSECIFNHITVRTPSLDPDEPSHYLINPYGLHYSEVTASNLVKIDSLGNRKDDSTYPVNPAGFTIHSAVHQARHDAHCVMHTHTDAGVAVATKDEGLRFDNFYAAFFYDELAYHEFEGVTVDDDESPRLVASLGAKNFLILRNHGLLVCGSSIANAFGDMWFLQRACEMQLASHSMGGKNREIDLAVLKRNRANLDAMAVGSNLGSMMFEGMLRHSGIRRVDVQ
ncbi:class II aldolase/adducin family protein [soil metagenome]